MRVIGGELRSRVIKSMPGLEVRPTPDRLRESLFNVLSPRLSAGVVFADLYAGTGAVGIEALSRGASHAVFVEQNRAAVRLIRENLRELDLEARARVHHGRATAALQRLEADIVFLDPPYALDREYESALAILGERAQAASGENSAIEAAASGVAKAPGLVIVQHSTRLALADCYGSLRRVRVLKQGDNAVSFFEPAGI